jgi:hypothetical protein
MAKYFTRILHRRLNNLGVFNITQKELRILRKKFIISTMPDKVKGTVFRENQMGNHKVAYDEQITN